jgi:hypothetical protein
VLHRAGSGRALDVIGLVEELAAIQWEISICLKKQGDERDVNYNAC